MLRKKADKSSTQKAQIGSLMRLSQTDFNRIIDRAKAHGATRLILFGSALEAPEQARDIDLACDGVSGWKLYELGVRLEEVLHMPLDLIPLSPRIALPR